MNLPVGTTQTATLVTQAVVSQQIDQQPAQDFSSPEITIPLSANVTADDPTAVVDLTLSSMTSPDATLQAALSGADGSAAGLSVTDSGAITALRLKPSANSANAARAAIEQALGQAVYRTVALPDAPVGIGARWVVRQQVSSEILLDQTTTVTLTAREGNRLSLAVDVSQTPQSPVWNLAGDAGTLNIDQYVMAAPETSPSTSHSLADRRTDDRRRRPGVRRSGQLLGDPADHLQQHSVGIVTRRSLALGLTATAALFVVTGCGSDDSPSADTTTHVSAPQVGLAPFTAAPAAPLSGAPLDRDALQRAALTLSELPADFDVVPDPVDDLGLAPAPESSEADKSRTDPAVCAQVLAPIATQAAGSVADLSDMFTGPDFTSIDQDSASYADGAAAAAAFEKLQTTLAGCAEYSGTDADGTTITYRVGGATNPNVGDASFAFRIITESGGFTLVADAIVAAVGATLTQVSATAPSPIAPMFCTRWRRPPQIACAHKRPDNERIRPVSA
ncbi:hypothetical protein GCM10020255_088070 [Rhodococcus baikonurensis]